jgi:hypothetical protein
VKQAWEQGARDVEVLVRQALKGLI